MPTITITAAAYFALEDRATNGLPGGARQNADTTWSTEVDAEVLERLNQHSPNTGDAVHDISAAILKICGEIDQARSAR